MVHTKKISLAIAALAGMMSFTSAAQAADAHAAPTPERQSWSFGGPFGKFDQAQLQRGFKVYREVCANCHSMSRVAIRTLGQEGGPEFSEAQVKALAAEYKVKDGPNESGEMFERAGRASDRFPAPFPNPEAARSALGAVPPDLSVIAKARSYSRGFPMFLLDAVIQYQEHGVDYIYALLNGYTDKNDPNWNEYFPGHKIGMAKPIDNGAVEYTDGSPATLQQYAKDVSAFLMWTAEPKLEERKKTGLRVMIFLLILAGLVYFTKKKVWANVQH